jgi:hypothetical protein
MDLINDSRKIKRWHIILRQQDNKEMEYTIEIAG